jgi:hypothetical protein
MERRQASFFALVAAQTAHSLEEYVGRLYDVFPPAVFVSGLPLSGSPTRLYPSGHRAATAWL